MRGVWARKVGVNLLVAAVALLPVLAQAIGIPALVLSVSGEVSREAIGRSPNSVEPYSRVLEGDRVKLGAASRLVLVYPGSGRQEIWVGPGAILSESGESRLLEGGAQVQVKALPPQIAAQMGKTPIEDASGKVGMVRMRAMNPDPNALQNLQGRYADLRRSAGPEDRDPEVYFLAGLFELGEYDRLRRELQQISQAYPNDLSIKVLTKLYDRAINNALQAKR